MAIQHQVGRTAPGGEGTTSPGMVIPGPPRLMIVGVGGAGGNAVNNMLRSKLVGCEFVVCNTDAQAIASSLAERRIQLGVSVTRGLGAGSRADTGRAAAEEALTEIMEAVQGSNMLFIVAGMGGGTGTGAAPVIARAAREVGILTVGVVTKPFDFEGYHRMQAAEAGILELQRYVDTLIIVPNQNLFRVASATTTLQEALNLADEVLQKGVRSITDLMVMPGLINLDFADIRAVVSEMGRAMMGTGEAGGEGRAVAAAEAAITNPLLEDVSLKGARGVLINISGGPDMTLFEVDEAANRIREEVDEDANIIFGSTFDEALEGRIRISVVATGIGAPAPETPVPETVVLEPALALSSDHKVQDVPIRPLADVQAISLFLTSGQSESRPQPMTSAALDQGTPAAETRSAPSFRKGPWPKDAVSSLGRGCHPIEHESSRTSRQVQSITASRPRSAAPLQPRLEEGVEPKPPAWGGET